MTPTSPVISQVSSDLSHEVRSVSPEEAGRWLMQVRNLSPLDQRQISAYARDMAASMWKLNGDPLIFDTGGILLSGRLRLHACVRAEKPFPTLIVRNVDPRHFDSIDALRRRTVADIMSIRQEHDGRALAAALTTIWRFANDDFPSMSKRVSSQAVVAVLEQNPDVRLSVNLAKGAAPALPHGMGGALHFLFSKVDSLKADEFFRLLSSDEIDTTAPVGLLKRQLEEGLSAGGNRNQAQLAGLAIKAWEAHRASKQISFVRFALGTDSFPKISGLGENAKLTGIRPSAANDSAGASSVLKNLLVRAEVVTPERAQAILDRNDRNRSIASAVVEKYARDMRNGTWALNGQTIKIADNGRLLDGQHRCAAAVLAGVTFPAIIVEGLDEGVFDTFDLGTRRSISAILRDRGENNTAVLGAVLRQVWLLDKKLITVRNVPPTISELLVTLVEHPGIRDSVRFSNTIRDISPSIALALHYFFRKASGEKADEFINRLGDGVYLGVDSPIRRLREILLEDRVSRKNRLGDTERAALFIKAWNSYLWDRPVRVLKWQTAGIRKEAFPAIGGLPGEGQ